MTAPLGAGEAYDAEDKMKRTILSTDGAYWSLSAAYVLELRRLINEGAYNTVHVADEIARRILRAGDL